MILLALLACDDTQFPSPPGGTAGAGSDYTAMQALFDAECTSCHGGAGFALGDLDLATDACAALVNVDAPNYAPAKYVVPGDHASSVLWNKIAATPTFGDSMPQNQAALSSDYVDGVAKWIDDGASCGAPVDTGDSGDTGDTGTPPPADYKLASVQDEVFTPYCVYCHAADADVGGEYAYAAEYPLTEGDSYATLVNQTAIWSLTGMKRVTPGDPENSFLWRKIWGPIDDQEGRMMPYDSPQLPPEKLMLVYGWIATGADAQ